MSMRLASVLAILALAAFGASEARAQNVIIVPACGAQSLHASPPIGQVFYMDESGNLCSSAVGGSITANTTATASVTPTAVTAGTGRALNMDLHSGLFVQPAFAGTPVDLTHGLPVNIVAGGATGSAFSAAFPANGTAIGLSDGTNMQAWLTALALGDAVNGNNTGAVATWLWNGATYDRQRGDLTNGAWVNVKASVLPAGGATAANQATANSSLSTIATNSAAAAPPATSGGDSTSSVIVPNNTTSVALKASAGQLLDLDGFSISAATPVWIKFYDAAQGSTTCGSGTPKLRYLVPGTGATGSGLARGWKFGVPFATAITYCITAGIADNDTTAPAASTYVVNFGYK